MTISDERLDEWILELVDEYHCNVSYVHLWRDITKLHASDGAMDLSIQRITGACNRLIRLGKLFKSARRGYVYGLKEKMRRDARQNRQKTPLSYQDDTMKVYEEGC